LKETFTKNYNITFYKYNIRIFLRYSNVLLLSIREIISRSLGQSNFENFKGGKA